MNSANDSYRYELKMVCEDSARLQVDSWVRLHRWSFRSAFPPRIVNNIYFDTPGLDTYNDHIEGVGLRRKLRFRWYGPDLHRACGQLEVKTKKGNVGWKLTQPVPDELDLDSMDWTQVSRLLSRQSADIYTHLLEVSRPVLINTYLREYYVSGDGNIRLTVDNQLKAFEQWLGNLPNVQFAMPLRDITVIEVKTDSRNGHSLSDGLAQFPLRVGAYSKYVEVVDGLAQR